MAIGLGVIGMNPTNMGSTATLLKDVPGLKYELRGMCAKRADVLEGYAAEIGVGFLDNRLSRVGFPRRHRCGGGLFARSSSCRALCWPGD